MPVRWLRSMGSPRCSGADWLRRHRCGTERLSRLPARSGRCADPGPPAVARPVRARVLHPLEGDHAALPRVRGPGYEDVSGPVRNYSKIRPIVDGWHIVWPCAPRSLFRAERPRTTWRWCRADHVATASTMTTSTGSIPSGPPWKRRSPLEQRPPVEGSHGRSAMPAPASPEIASSARDPPGDGDRREWRRAVRAAGRKSQARTARPRATQEQHRCEGDRAA